MSRHLKAPVIALSAVLALAPIASVASGQQPKKRTIIVRRVYVVPTYDPFFYDPFYYSPYRYGYLPPTTGDVKLKTDLKNAVLYVDGGYAEKVDGSERVTLAPGTHQIELRDSEGRVLFSQQVNVMLGKTTTIDLRGVIG